LIGEYIPSKRNGQVAELYARLGFDPADSGGEPGRFWTWDLANGVPTDSAHIRTIDRWRDPS
jgi:hypothetical protein